MAIVNELWRLDYLLGIQRPVAPCHQHGQLQRLGTFFYALDQFFGVGCLGLLLSQKQLPSPSVYLSTTEGIEKDTKRPSERKTGDAGKVAGEACLGLLKNHLRGG